MAKNSQKKSQKFFADRLKQINSVISKLEKEVEKAIQSVRAQSKKSTKMIMQSFDEIVGKLGASDIKNLAVEKTDELRKEVIKLSDDIVSNIKNMDLNFDKSVFSNIKDNVNTVVQKVQDLEIFEYAKGKVADTKNQVLSLLKIPSQSDVDNLSRKVINLEKKLSIVAGHERKVQKPVKRVAHAAKRKTASSHTKKAS